MIMMNDYDMDPWRERWTLEIRMDGVQMNLPLRSYRPLTEALHRSGELQFQEPRNPIHLTGHC